VLKGYTRRRPGNSMPRYLPLILLVYLAVAFVIYGWLKVRRPRWRDGFGGLLKCHEGAYYRLSLGWPIVVVLLTVICAASAMLLVLRALVWPFSPRWKRAIVRRFAIEGDIAPVSGFGGGPESPRYVNAPDADAALQIERIWFSHVRSVREVPWDEGRSFLWWWWKWLVDVGRSARRWHRGSSKRG
jgi:hypothetical protein